MFSNSPLRQQCSLSRGRRQDKGQGATAKIVVQHAHVIPYVHFSVRPTAGRTAASVDDDATLPEDNRRTSLRTGPPMLAALRTSYLPPSCCEAEGRAAASVGGVLKEKRKRRTRQIEQLGVSSLYRVPHAAASAKHELGPACVADCNPCKLRVRSTSCVHRRCHGCCVAAQKRAKGSK